MFAKNSVVRIFVFLSMLVVLPQTASADDSTRGKELKDIAKHDDSKRLKKLALQICANYSLAGSQIAQDSKAAIQRYMARYEGIKNPTGKQMLQFLNTNKHKLNCKIDGVEINYMMVAFDRSAHNALFEELMFSNLTPRDRKIRPDVNAVSYTGSNGTPETVLDYVNRIIANKRNSRAYIKEVQNLKETFVKHLDAKRFEQLSAKEQAAFNKAKPK